MRKLAMWLVKGYQRYLSPLLPASCRYYPTCSTYTIQALSKHGLIKGLIMGTARILRCNPFVKGGLDPVPDFFTLRRNPDPQKNLDESAQFDFHR